MGYHRPLVAVAGGVNLAVLSRRIVVDRLRSLRAPDGREPRPDPRRRRRVHTVARKCRRVVCSTISD